MAMDLKKILRGGESGDEEESGSGEEYDMVVSDLQDILGIDEGKATRLRDAFCALAREEMAASDEEEEPKSSRSGRPSVASILRSAED